MTAWPDLRRLTTFGLAIGPAAVSGFPARGGRPAEFGAETRASLRG